MQLAELLALVESSWRIDENEYVGIPPLTDPRARQLYAANRIVLQLVRVSGRMAGTMGRADHGYRVNLDILKVSARKMLINALRLAAALGMTPLEIEREITQWAEREREKSKPAVHALWEGRPLCGFSLAATNLWPEGHTFVVPTDIEAVTCRTCESEARCWKARRYIDVLAAGRLLDNEPYAWLRIHASECEACRSRLLRIA